VRKHDWHGHFRYAWRGTVLERTGDKITLEAFWSGPGEPTVGRIRFVHGDRFLEHYYPGRGYAIWQIERPDGEVKAWYCNISTPVRQENDVLTFDDLLLDVLAYPDGGYVVLDRDEFEEARRHGLPAEYAQQAETALAAVLALVNASADPFRFSHAPRLLEQD
jgi:predicted RNA-binding protein associated with RNAse of E/G family